MDPETTGVTLYLWLLWPTSIGIATCKSVVLCMSEYATISKKIMLILGIGRTL
jgi:hypothetical protein